MMIRIDKRTETEKLQDKMIDIEDKILVEEQKGEQTRLLRILKHHWNILSNELAKEAGRNSPQEDNY